MAARTFRSRTPRPEREPVKEKEKSKKLTLEEHCMAMKQRMVGERMEVIRQARQEELRKAEEEVMRMTYGPNWKESA
jgi:hypothetical protein